MIGHDRIQLLCRGLDFKHFGEFRGVAHTLVALVGQYFRDLVDKPALPY
jgi:hypothetical protein